MSESVWQPVRLREVASFASGRTPSRSRQADYFDMGTIPWVKTLDLTNSGIRTTDESITPRAIREVKIQVQPPGTVLVAMYGGFNQIGRTGVLRMPATTNQAITSILPDRRRLNPDYLLHLLNFNVGYWRMVASSSRKDPNITKADVQDFPLSLPPLSEQDAISCAINDAGDLITMLSAALIKKQAMKQGMMQQLLTGRTRLPGFDGEWRTAPFGNLAATVGERADARTVPADTRLIELEHVSGATGQLLGSSTAGTAISLKTVFQPGDILFGKLRSYLRKYWLADSSGLCSTEFWVLRPKNNNVSEFVRYTVETDSFIEAASGGYGTHMPRADWNVVRRVAVAVPEPLEQRAIANLLGDADRELKTLRSRLEKARFVKQGMMQQLLTGRTRLPVPEVTL